MNSKFLFEFTDDRLLFSLAGFKFAAREFPTAAHLSGWISVCDENVISVQRYARNRCLFHTNLFLILQEQHLRKNKVKHSGNKAEHAEVFSSADEDMLHVCRNHGVFR